MQELKKEFKNNYDVDDSNAKNWKLKAHGQEVIIPAGKEDNSKVMIKIGTTNLKEVSDLNSLYGETTDYTSVTGVNWQLFFSDDYYIYLIASDYVPIDTLPSELIKENQAEGETKYKAWFANWDSNIKNYIGTIMDNTPWKNGVDSITITENPQTNIYLRWVNSSLVSVKNNPNIKAVAFMFDINKWKNFAGEAKGAYAIGGPTIEMFVLSYNAKHEDYLGTYETINNTNANSYGYYTR